MGIAVSDATGTLASPYGAVARMPDRSDTAAAIAAIASEAEVGHVLVGLPRTLSGAERAGAAEARLDAAAIEAATGLPVELCDERLTTVSAARGQRSRGTKAKKGRATIDAEAAAVLLQAWLDGPRGREITRG